MSKISHFLLYVITYFILEPRLKSGKWKVREKTLASLRPQYSKLCAAYDRAQLIFKRLDLCRSCGGECCYGDYNRFSIYDHISHLVSCMGNPPEWSYKLHPLRSHVLNRSDEGVCSHFIPGKGCRFSCGQRPSVCLWWTCEKMDKLLTGGDKRLLRNIRHGIDSVHWIYARSLLFGGMERTKNGE